MHIKNDESRIEDFLKNTGFSCQRFSKGEKKHGKNPDFKVYKNNELIFFCEVKTIEKDNWASGARNDPIFNRITDDIHTAIKQFDAVNKNISYPNVLTFVNYDSMCDIEDLISTLTGLFFADDGKQYPIYRQFSSGRIKSEKMRIHLYIWFDNNNQPKLLFNQSNRIFYLKLCQLFGKDPSKIKSLPS